MSSPEKSPRQANPPNADLGGPTHYSKHDHMTKIGPDHPITMSVNNANNEGRRGRNVAEDNVPNRFELFLLGDGEKKVTEEPDTRVPNTSVFTFNKEDHTLGNLLRSRLLQSPHVEFSGYKVPHPLFSKFELRVGTDGTLSPRQALVEACKSLVSDLSILSREFTKEWELRKMVGDGGEGGPSDQK